MSTTPYILANLRCTGVAKSLVGPGNALARISHTVTGEGL